MRTEPAAARKAAPSTPSPVTTAPNRAPETGSGQEHAQQRRREKGTTPAPREHGPAPASREHGTAPASREHGAAPASREHGAAPAPREHGAAPAPREQGTAPASREQGTAPVPREEGTAPVQDEWGFFDPQQCGFSALLTKLDEISEDEKRSTKKRA